MQDERIHPTECEALVKRFAPHTDADFHGAGLTVEELAAQINVAPSLLRAALADLRREEPVQEPARDPQPEPTVVLDGMPAAFRPLETPAAPQEELTPRPPAAVVGPIEQPVSIENVLEEQAEPLAGKPAWNSLMVITACTFAMIAVGVLLRVVWINTAPQRPVQIGAEPVIIERPQSDERTMARSTPFTDEMPGSAASEPAPLEDPSNAAAAAPDTPVSSDERPPQVRDNPPTDSVEDGSGIGPDAPVATEPQPEPEPAADPLPDGPGGSGEPPVEEPPTPSLN